MKIPNVIPVLKVKPPVRFDTDIRPISLTTTAGNQVNVIGGGWLLPLIEDKFDKNNLTVYYENPQPMH